MLLLLLIVGEGGRMILNSLVLVVEVIVYVGAELDLSRGLKS